MKSYTKKLYLCALGLFLLDLSSTSFVSGSIYLNFLCFPQFAFYSVMGFLHAWTSFSLRNLIEKHNANLLDFIGLFLIYTSWYNIVLLPLSGLGIIEWSFVLLILLCSVLNQQFGKKLNNTFTGQNPLIYTILGTILFFVKEIIFFLFPENIYLETFTGNSTARFFIFALCIIGIIMLFIQLKKSLNLKANKPKKNSVKSFFDRIWIFIKSLVNLAVTAFSLPAVLIALSIIGLLMISFGAIKLNGIYTDILKMVEPYLKKIASTGKSSVHLSMGYNICQTIALITVLFYEVFSAKALNEKLVLELNKKLIKFSSAANLTEVQKLKLKEQVNNNLEQTASIQDKICFLKSPDFERFLAESNYFQQNISDAAEPDFLEPVKISSNNQNSSTPSTDCDHV